jgi:hypothetical protein
MENTVSDNTVGLMTPPAIVGEVEAGQGAKTRKQLQNLIKSINSSTFDVMDLLYEIKTKKYYLPKYESFIEYAKTLNMKVAKAYYLVRIRENMHLASISREKYEPVGIAKLRVIASIDLIDSENRVKTDAVAKVNELVDAAGVTDAGDLKVSVDTFNGHVGEEAFEWLNIKIKKSAKAVVRQALDLIKAQLGSTGTDADGVAKDASDGRALEMLAADFIADPNNTPDVEALGVSVVEENDAETIVPDGAAPVPAV